MEVLVVDRSTWGTPGPYPYIRKITINNKCPKCGGPRGKPYRSTFFENDDYHTVHKWKNECGHIDMYDECLEEAKTQNGDSK